MEGNTGAAHTGTEVVINQRAIGCDGSGGVLGDRAVVRVVLTDSRVRRSPLPVSRAGPD